MPRSKSTPDTIEMESVRYVHCISEAGRLIPSASKWNSIELDFNLFPKSSISYDSLPSEYSKSVDFNLTITNRKYFKRFLYVCISLVLVIIAIGLLVHFLVHRHGHQDSSNDLTPALNRALAFFDAQKSGVLPKNNTVKFRGDSGLKDGNTSDVHANLVGGFYDSGNNIKFSFPTAYTVTLLSWTVIEYHEKYANIDELDHIKDIIKWGSSYLLKLFVPSNSSSDPTILYSQVGGASNSSRTDNDINCWQRPEDMTYQRPVSVCRNKGSDLAGEMVAALSAASLVFRDEKNYSAELTKAAEKLFVFAKADPQQQGNYTSDDACGGEARQFYNSSGYFDELVWGGTWLFFATGNASYLGYVNDIFTLAETAELDIDKGVFDWNNKLTASAILLTRLRIFNDPGYPYEDTLKASLNKTRLLMCSYLSRQPNRTPGGLILLRPDHTAPLQYAATASFLSKLYTDYLYLTRSSPESCGTYSISLEMLKSFSMSQIDYILGNNPLKMSYLVGYGDQYPTQVHHRGASIPWDNQRHHCAEGKRWLNSKEPNPNLLLGAMVAGPNKDDKFLDVRGEPEYTEPSISGNAGLVAALIAHHDYPLGSSIDIGLDQLGIFKNIHPDRLNGTAH